MIARLFIMFYAIASYAVFFVSFIWALGFVGNYNQFIAKSIDTGPPGDWGEAILIDVALLALFALQHSVMARPAFKRWWTRVIPAAAERSTYVLLTSLMLLLLFWQWRPIPAPVWRRELVSTSLTPSGRRKREAWVLALPSVRRSLKRMADRFPRLQSLEAGPYLRCACRATWRQPDEK